MTNNLVGDVYQKIIEEVVKASSDVFDESGVNSQTLQELRVEWQVKLSARGVAAMPWDPKPVQLPQRAPPSALTHGLPQSAYPSYNGPVVGMNGGPRVKIEPGTEAHYNGLPNGYAPQNAPSPQGGLVRAQQLVQQYGESSGRGGLALPGQHRPQGPPLPGQQAAQQQYSQQQHQQMLQRQQLLHQQTQPRIKVENNSPQLNQGQFQQQQHQRPNAAYAQTDGAGDGLEEWQTLLSQRRAIFAEETQRADRMVHDYVVQGSSDLQSGLMVPLDEQPKRSKGKGRLNETSIAEVSGTTGLKSRVPQMDGPAEDDDEEKPDIKDEDDENAINSDLDDPDEDAQGPMGDEDDELGDTILCTYDKVQRVKNKWKCTLKDGVMSTGGKDWVFHKGMGEFEW